MISGSKLGGKLLNKNLISDMVYEGLSTFIMRTGALSQDLTPRSRALLLLPEMSPL